MEELRGASVVVAGAALFCDRRLVEVLGAATTPLGFLLAPAPSRAAPNPEEVVLLDDVDVLPALVGGAAALVLPLRDKMLALAL